MSVLTFLTAPWAVGTLYLALKGQARAVHVVRIANHAAGDGDDCTVLAVSN
jgi:hypothetical protein